MDGIKRNKKGQFEKGKWGEKLTPKTEDLYKFIVGVYKINRDQFGLEYLPTKTALRRRFGIGQFAIEYRFKEMEKQGLITQTRGRNSRYKLVLSKI